MLPVPAGKGKREQMQSPYHKSEPIHLQHSSFRGVWCGQCLSVRYSQVYQSVQSILSERETHRWPLPRCRQRPSHRVSILSFTWNGSYLTQHISKGVTPHSRSLSLHTRKGDGSALLPLYFICTLSSFKSDMMNLIFVPCLHWSNT